MLQAFGLSYEPDPLVGLLFQDVNLSVEPGEIVALVGKNGTGKTMLLEILAGVRRPTGGRVVDSNHCRIGYLPQDVDVSFGSTLAEYLETDDPGMEAALKRTMAWLGLDTVKLDQPYQELSLGERIRAALARVVGEGPSVLLLDEPTNHLDIEAREWLIRFLQGTRQAVLMVCHDRAVVNATADRVLELANGTLTEYSGNYDDMVRLKEVRNARQRETYEKQLAEERRLKNSVEKTHQVASSMTKRPTGRTYDPKAKAFYAGKEAKLDRRAKAIRSRAEQVRERLVEKPFEEESTALRFFAKPLRHPDALTVRGLRKSYGERELFGNLSITLGRGERVAVVGPNGAGKTTLFRILLGEENPDAGTVEWTSDAAPAFLSQARNALDPEKTILEALDPVGEEQIRFVRTLLARLRIRGDAVHKPVGVLSVGERTKVELVSMLMSPANVLLLDEPTNHLDVDSMDALESALKEFPGSVIFTSHDATFVERTADTVVRIGGAD